MSVALKEYNSKSHPKEWNSWRAMKQRCLYKKYRRYDRYGGRGIKVCDRWLGKNGFSNFCKDMGEKPTPKHTIDRIDNDGHYEPSNCRWADQKTQVNNSTAPKIVNVDGIVMNLSDHIKRVGYSESLVYKRMAKGYSVEQALTEPNNGIEKYRAKKKRKYLGKKMSSIIIVKKCNLCGMKCSSYKKMFCSVTCSNIGRIKTNATK